MRTHALLIVSILLLFSSPSWAQSELPAHKWSHCTTLALSGGVATATDHTGPTASTSIGWEITPRVGVEASGMWFGKQTGSSAFAGGLTARALLTQSHPTAPFVEGGFGVYSASFDPKRATEIPPFYSDRMSGISTNRFTDPAFFTAVGLDVFRSNRVAVRPAIGAIIAVHDGRAYTVGTATVRVEYHFGGLPPAASLR